jgi:hypothetical protein
LRLMAARMNLHSFGISQGLVAMRTLHLLLRMGVTQVVTITAAVIRTGVVLSEAMVVDIKSTYPYLLLQNATSQGSILAFEYINCY